MLAGVRCCCVSDTVVRDGKCFAVADVLEARAARRRLAARRKLLHARKHDLHGGAVKRPVAYDLRRP